MDAVLHGDCSESAWWFQNCPLRHHLRCAHEALPPAPKCGHYTDDFRDCTLVLLNVRASLMAQMVKNLPAIRDPSSIPGLGRSPGEKMATHSSILAWRGSSESPCFIAFSL